MSPNRVVFLDRDGVINRDSPDYIKCWDEFTFIDGSIDAICKLTQAGYDVIVVTNQSGIGRGLITPQNLADMHRNLKCRVAADGGKIKDIFFCPHSPDAGCQCRKPLPGMLFAAQKKHAIDFSSAIMVGDSAKDILCGRHAGLKATVLVKTGDYENALNTLSESGIAPDHVAESLLHAVKWIIVNDS